MVDVAPALPITFRSAEPDDAVGILRVYIERKFDAEPGHAEYSEARIAWWQKNGEAEFRRYTDDARVYPERFFSHVALRGGVVIGFAHAEAPEPPSPKSGFAVWRGLAVASDYERRGIGQRLEAVRQAWALRVGRRVLAEVVSGNRASMGFFRAQGFEFVGTLDATTERPFPLHIVQLGVTALQRNVGSSNFFSKINV